MKNDVAILLTDTHIKENNHEKILQLFAEAIEIAKEKKIPIIHLGDNFDSRKSQPLNNLIVFEKILEMFENEGVHLYSIVGNHDKVDQSKEESYLSPYKHFPNFTLIDSHLDTSINGLCINFVSFFTDQEYIDLLKGCYNNGKDVCLITHIDIKGFLMNSGQESSHGFDKKVFKNYGKVLVGHYHDASINGNIEYIGASLQHNYGENHTNKGIKLLHSDMSVSLVKETKHIQSFSTFKVHSLVELENLKVSEIEGNKRIVFVGSKEELVSISKGKSKAIDEILKDCKVVFKEKDTIAKDFSEINVNGSLSKESIRGHFIDWAKQEQINDIEHGLKLLEEI